MDKIKKVFSPGSSKDDEVLYGDAETRRQSASAAPTTDAPQLHTVQGADKKEHGILRQILNPGGDKHDDQRFGSTASTEPPHVDPAKLQTDPEADKSDKTILRQILNPNNAKYDEQRFTDTAATGGDRKNSIPAVEPSPVVGSDTQLQTDPGKKDRSVLRQILNPHGDKYDEQSFGTTARAVGDHDAAAIRSDSTTNPDSSIMRQVMNPGQEKYDPVVHGSGQPSAAPATSSAAPPSHVTGTASSPPHTRGDITPGSCLSVKSGVEGPFAARDADYPTTGAGSTAQTLPDRTTTTTATTTNTAVTHPTTDETHYGRDAAIAGGLATAGGAGAYAGTRGGNDGESMADRPHPLGGSSTEAAYSTTAPSQTTTGYGSTESKTTAPHSVGPAGGAHINPVGAPEERLTSSTEGSHLGRDETLVGGVTTAGATGAAASTQLNSAPSDVQSATFTERSRPVGDGTYHHFTGPHPTDTGNRLDPHVPGEFPTETGQDRHGVNDPSLAAVNSSAGATTTATETGASQEKSSLPTVGAIASAVGLGGLVGGAASKAGTEKTEKPTQTEHATTHPGGQGYPIQTTTNSLSSAPAEAQGTAAVPEEKGAEHHYGRDTAIAGGVVGAGAAGYGIHEATRDGNEPATRPTETATQTAAPRTTTTQSTTTRTVPQETSTTRTVPQEKSTTSAVQQTADPEAEKKDHHYGRDAALVGGAGAVGAGTIAASQHDDKSAEPPMVSAQKTREDATRSAPTSDAGHTVYILDGPPGAAEDKTTSKAREDDAGKTGDKSEKKPSLLHRILHPGHKSSDDKPREEDPATATTLRKSQDPSSADDHARPSGSALNHPIIAPEDLAADNRVSTDDRGHNKLHKKSVEQASGDAAVIEPHTGLPMNVAKYGSGAGGTDGAPQIAGYHEPDPAVRGA